jgi:hypothetical protein
MQQQMVNFENRQSDALNELADLVVNIALFAKHKKKEQLFLEKKLFEHTKRC